MATATIYGSAANSGYLHGAKMYSWPTSALAAYLNQSTVPMRRSHVGGAGQLVQQMTFLEFDTSSIPVGSTTTNVVIWAYIYSIIDSGAGSCLYGDWHDYGTLTTADWFTVGNSGTATNGSVTLAGTGTGWNSTTLLNPSSLVEGGTTRFRFWIYPGNTETDDYFDIYSNDATYKPYLVITYTPPGYANQVDGVAAASISAVNGVLTANVSKVFGA